MISAFFENFRLAVGAFIAHPLRTLLTLLGVIIGVMTVVSMMGLLEGLQNKVTKDFTLLGANVFRVDKWPQGARFSGGGIDWNRIARRPRITADDRTAIVAMSPHVLRTSLSVGRGAQRIRTAQAETLPNVQVLGATQEWADTSGVTLFAGRFFTAEEVNDSRAVAVIGPDVADKLFPRTPAIGGEIRVANRNYTVIGVTERRGKVLGMFNLDNNVVIPLDAWLSSYGRLFTLTISVEALDRDSVEKAMEETTRALRLRRRLSPNDEDNFEISTNTSMAQQLIQITQLVKVATFGVCLISLIVGGIGILNIMMVSVSERTQEIGIRRAIGASRRRILAQFTIEALLLSLLGGLIGLAMGYGLAALSQWGFGFPASIPAWAVVLSIVMSLGVGLVFGVYPAVRASKLDPVEAMRSE